MSLIDRQRETAISENSGQKTIFDVLENLFATDTDIFFKEPLVGDIDLEVLKECNFTNIEKLRFSPGQITSLKNIPKNIKELSCPKNLLIQVDDLPESLEMLDLEGNGIKHIDISKLKELKVLKISENILIELDNLPPSLEQIFCNNNDLRKLDLDGVTKLDVLHCSGNRALTIHNMPENVTDFNNENLPTNEILRHRKDDDDEIPKYDVYESLNKYFMLKTEYESRVKAQQHTLYKRVNNKAAYKKEMVKLKPQCINCKRPVGTIFSCKNRTYTALCGSPDSGCNLNIKIFAGEYDNLQEAIRLFEGGLEENKENIIKMKMDTLMEYVSESKVSKEFKEEYEEYNSNNDILMEVKNKYNQLHFSKDKREKMELKKIEIQKMIMTIKELVNEYKKLNSRDVLKDIVELYKKKLLPEILNLRHLKYSIMEMEEDQETGQHKLYQNDTFINEVDICFGEQPKVIKFLGNF